MGRGRNGRRVEFLLVKCFNRIILVREKLNAYCSYLVNFQGKYTNVSQSVFGWKFLSLGRLSVRSILDSRCQERRVLINSSSFATGWSIISPIIMNWRGKIWWLRIWSATSANKIESATRKKKPISIWISFRWLSCYRPTIIYLPKNTEGRQHVPG